MKKIFLAIFLSILSFSFETKAFLWEDSWLNLYKNIDSGFEELEQKQYKYELAWQWKGITENINSVLQAEWIWECINTELAEATKIKQIEDITHGSMENLTKVINAKCKIDNEQITLKKLINIQNTLKKLNNLSKSKAKEKAKQIYSISKIWIYSDGNEENSPFDLINDLQDIDQIIFGSKIEYEWEDLPNNDELMDCILWNDKSINPFRTFQALDVGKAKECYEKLRKDNKEPAIQEPQIIKDIKENIKNNWQWKNNSDKNKEKSTIENNYICADDTNNSWLSKQALNNLINDIKSGDNNNWDSNANNWNGQTNKNNNTKDNKSGGKWWYEKVYDTLGFPPCNNFFCLTIEYVKYQHKLLAWWESISIKYLIDRSNKHLKKFAATSLIPAKMSTNNFELGLKTPSLPNMFHLNFVITSKPVPILDLQPKTQKDESWKFWNKNLLEEYYKNLWLEYTRRNDLNKFIHREEELKTILSSAALSIPEALKKDQQFKSKLSKIAETNGFVQKTVEKKISSEEFENFEKQFIELQLFSKSMYDYVVSISAIIKAMNEIPIDKG
jgi:hypothetical protein